MAAARSLSLLARASIPICRCSAVRGVRSSCAASAMKARSRCQRRLQASEQIVERQHQRLHLIRAGSARAAPSSASTRRVFTCAVSRCSGSSACPTASQISSASTGSSSAKGLRVCSASSAARCARTLIGCATWMTRVSACTPNTRQRPSLVVTVAKPRVVISGQHGVRSRQVDAHAIERPHLHHEVVGGIRLRQLRCQQVLDRLVAQDECGLAQVVVEEGVGFRQRVLVHHPAAAGPHHHHRRQEPGEQARAQRAHAAGLTR